jgi:hypothetical protein
VLAAIRAVFFSLSFTLLPAAQRRGRGVGASRRILSARWQPTQECLLVRVDLVVSLTTRPQFSPGGFSCHLGAKFPCCLFLLPA